MDRRRVLAAALTLAVSWATAGCDVQVGEGDFSLGVVTGRARDTWSRSYPLTSGSRFELINVNGRIVAEPAAGDTLEISAERIAKASSDEAAKAMLDQVDMREETGERRVRLEVRAPRSFGGGVEVRWTVKVPKDVIVDLRNTNGKVQVSGLGGEVHARTVNGGVEARGLTAQMLDASTVNGGVDIEFTEPLGGQGKVALECVNGGVRLALPPTSKASVVARVTNGGISTGELAFSPTGEQSRRRFEGTLNGGGTAITLQTTNGGVRLSKSES